MSDSLCQRGQIILEVLIAFAIFMLSIGSVVITTYGADQLSLDAGLSQHALYRAQDALDRMSADAKKNGNITSSSVDYGQYQQDIAVQYASPFSQRVDVIESWNASQERHEQVTLSTFMGSGAAALGNAPCAAIAGNSIHGTPSGFLDIGSANHGTDLEVDGHYAYLATDSSSVADPDFFVIDISDSSHPSISASINTGPGLTSVRVVGNYAYVANTSRTAQLQIIDIHDSVHPSVISSVKLSGVSGSGTAGVGNSIYYADGKVYLGTTKATGPELHIVNVFDPIHPSELASWEADTSINGIVQAGSHLYVATPTTSQLTVFDITDSSRLREITQFNPNDASTNNGQSILLAGSFLYFGRNAKATSGASAQQLFFLDTAHEDSLSTLNGVHIGASINDIVGHTGHLALATNDTVNSIQLWNVGDPVHPIRDSVIHLDAIPVALACDEAYLYVALDSGHALQIVGLSP